MAIPTVGGEAGAAARALIQAEATPPGLARAAGARGAEAAQRAASGDVGGALEAILAQPFYKAMPKGQPTAVRAEAFAPAKGGYARPAGAAQATSTKGSAAKASATRTASAKASAAKASAAKSSAAKTSTSKGELAFLDDKHLSIEDKLFQFMALMQAKDDKELVDAMKSYQAKKTAAAQQSASATAQGAASGSGGGGGGGGGLFGVIGDALGGIGKAVVGGAATLAKDLGGPVLAGVATAVGAPYLAPVALELGGSLASAAVGGLASAIGLDGGSGKSASTPKATATSPSAGAATTSTGTSTSTSTTKADDTGEFDDKLEMMKLQLLVEKQSTMFNALSNVMKATHDSQMVAVNNIR